MFCFVGYSFSSPTENFCAVPTECLGWVYRFNLILKFISTYNPDVICLEEVDHFDQIKEKLALDGYVGDFMLRTGSQVDHGVALFYKTAKFDLVETFKNYLHEESGEVGSQGLLINLLKDKATKKQVLIGVVHLKAKRPFHKRRLAQTKSALAIFEGISTKHPNVPIIWGGDFNGEDNENFHKSILESNLSLKSSYETVLGKEPDFTTWKIRPSYEERHTIDYIWFSEGKINAQDVLQPMTDDLVPESRYPSLDHPSDHILLCSDFKYV